MPENRIQLLDSIGFIWDPTAQKWQEKYHEFKQYVDTMEMQVLLTSTLGMGTQTKKDKKIENYQSNILNF